MKPYTSGFVEACGIRTHFLEAGSGPDLVLLHSGEFGGCAELSWENTIGALAEHFHVLAPDWLGYGQTEKLFSFDDMKERRERHIGDFLKAMGVEHAQFIGNSMGGTMLIAAAASSPKPWPIDSIIVISGGGSIPDNDARQILNSYDGTREHMRQIIETMFVDPAIRTDEGYLDRRYQLSIEPGAWECTAAVRFKAPHREKAVGRVRPAPTDYSVIDVPVLLVTGEDDPLREPGFGPALQAEIPGSELLVIPQAGHCPHIEHPDLFTARALEFLLAERGA